MAGMGTGFVAGGVGGGAGLIAATRSRGLATCRRRAVRMAGEDPMLPRPNRGGPFAAVAELVGAFRRLVGLEETVDESLLYLGEEGFEPLFEEEPPTVLVVGATGEVGRIIVRKLLLRGYRVRVLVRNLFSETLDLLGTGCGYVMGDVNDPYSLMEAATGVDKIVCALRARTPEEIEAVEFNGVQNMLRAFHDTRHADYGRAEATKVTLFKFDRTKDFKRWTPISSDESDAELGRAPARVEFKLNTRQNAMFVGKVYDTYGGHAELSCKLKKVNMTGFSGIVLRCLGDGKQYRMVLRTGRGDEAGVVYETIFGTVENKWITVRLPLVSFRPRSNDPHIPRELEELDRSDVREFKIEYRKPLINPERDDGLFSLTLDFMKAYRTQDEADMVLVSCSRVTEQIKKRRDSAGSSAPPDPALVFKFKSEEALRNSGISYCIIRSGKFTDQTGGNRALVLEQNADEPNKEISRTDLAEVCVAALQDPRARNVTFDAFESLYAPTAQVPSRDIGTMLEGLKPNS